MGSLEPDLGATRPPGAALDDAAERWHRPTPSSRDAPRGVLLEMGPCQGSSPACTSGRGMRAAGSRANRSTPSGYPSSSRYLRAATRVPRPPCRRPDARRDWTDQAGGEHTWTAGDKSRRTKGRYAWLGCATTGREPPARGPAGAALAGLTHFLRVWPHLLELPVGHDPALVPRPMLTEAERAGAAFPIGMNTPAPRSPQPAAADADRPSGTLDRPAQGHRANRT